MIHYITNISPTVSIFLSMIGVLIGLVALIYAISIQIYAVKLKKRYISLVRGESGIDMETLIQNINNSIGEMKNKIIDQEGRIENHESRLRKKSNQPIIKRYNAFGESGNDLSFSIAILSEEGDGIVLSSIYGRDDSIVFAKPVIEKQSSYKLTTEEQEVIVSVK